MTQLNLATLEQARQTWWTTRLTIKHIQVPHALASTQDIGQPELLPFVQVDAQAALYHDEDPGLAVLAHAK